MPVFQPVSSDASFADDEHQVLALWDKVRAFSRSVEEKSRDKSFIFYDGPPFATGLPHYGHLVASTLKDIVPRYWTMRGYRVERRFGWDTHGLPIEMDVEKRLGLSGPSSIREYGVDKFNEECRAGVLRYVDEWRKTVTRVGRWVDFDNDYKTMDLSFMESVWWVFRQLWDKGLVYKGLRVMPYSWRLSTALSNFEAGLDYRDVDDPAITLKLKLDGEDASLLIWTTTPWTLPSNLAVAVGPDVDYVKARHEDGHDYWVAKDLAKQVLGDKHEVKETTKGAALVGRTYAPMFPYFADRKQQGAFRVIASAHVTTTDGTGLVHMAPAFGEDDFNACKRAGIDVVDPVNDEGAFTAAVSDYAGQNIKEADKHIIADLKKKGLIFRHATIRHSYPFCWRSGAPLIYKTTPSWYVKVEQLRDRMVKANDAIHWVPESIGSARFKNWLQEARDWSISRSRFWGTPMPIWQSDDGEETLCIGSVQELQELTGHKVTDLHPHKIDHLTITSKETGKVLKRIPDVFDCWFESGAMPYAQGHYPFEDKDHFESAFPAQFIAEGLDQTRGWFYTLLVLSTALFDKAPFQNVIVNGLVLATVFADDEGNWYLEKDVDLAGGKAVHKETGKQLKVRSEKMSKSKRNYPAPEAVIEQYGADALRAYLINSPVVRAEPLKFQEEGLREVVRTVMLPLQNALSFFVTYANIDNWDPKTASSTAPSLAARPEIDRWILSVLQSLVRDINAQMEGYYLYKVVPPMLGFIDDLTNWYIRRCRRRFWRNESDGDKMAAYATLYEVLVTFAQVLAPVMPFQAENIYQRLVVAPGVPGAAASVHLCSYPLVDEGKIDRGIEEAMASVRAVVGLGRALREKHKLKTRQPLARVTVVTHDEKAQKHLRAHAALLFEELNVKDVVVVKDDASLAALSFKANFKTLGKKLGPKMKTVASAIEKLERAQWTTLEDGDSLVLEGETITKEDVVVSRTASGNVVLETEGDLTVALDTTLSEQLVDEGLMREVVSKLQQLRKDSGLAVTDRIVVRARTEDARLRQAVEAYRSDILEEVLGKELTWSLPNGGADVDVNGHAAAFLVEKA